MISMRSSSSSLSLSSLSSATTASSDSFIEIRSDSSASSCSSDSGVLIEAHSHDVAASLDQVMVECRETFLALERQEQEQEIPRRINWPVWGKTGKGKTTATEEDIPLSSICTLQRRGEIRGHAAANANAANAKSDDTPLSPVCTLKRRAEIRRRGRLSGEQDFPPTATPTAPRHVHFVPGDVSEVRFIES